MNSFRNRLLVLIIGLIAVTQTVTLVAVLESTRRNVEARAAEQLTAGTSYALQLVKFRASQLASGVAVLAADFGFREAVSLHDPPTILSAASNQSRRIDADLLLLVDTQGKLIAATERADPNFVASTDDLVDRALMSPDMPHFAMLSGRLYQFFAAPVRAPDTIAWVVMGFVVSDALAHKIGDLVGVDVSFIAIDGGVTRIVASTLEPAFWDLIPALPQPDPSGMQAPGKLMSGAEEFLVHVVDLEPGNHAVRLLLQKPSQEVLAPFLAVRNAMLVVSGTALLLAMIVAVLLGRSATRPIDKLVVAARRIEGGQYREPIAVSGSEEFRRLAGTLNAMQERVAEREAHIRHQAYHDELTGLPNRAQAESELARMLVEASGKAQVTVMVIHLSNLRELNASLGHRIGDEVLVATARRLTIACQSGEHVGRLGASRYVMLLSRRHKSEDATRLAANVIDILREPLTLGQVDVELQVAAGLCTSPEQGGAADEMIRRAEIALHDAEESRERIGLFRIGSDEEHRRRLEIMTDLRRAIDSNGLQLAFQPKVAIATRRVTSVEALVRWTHPKLGPIPPAEFVPLAEQTGGSRQLSDWVLRTAIRQMAEWRRGNLMLDVAINLSAADIVDAGLGDVILRLLAEYRVAATSLVLEITESAMMRNPIIAAQNMELLRVAGVRFAIDDFGTGYSSLSQLRKLPVDELKIDRSFVSRAHLDADDASIVSSTIELGHNLGLKVVAEGVEVAETLLMLRKLGCDYAQGYLISKPMPADEVAAYVREANQVLEDSDSTLIQVRALERLSTRR
jgi:diguanylate cyclase (GGDEF)-like protein